MGMRVLVLGGAGYIGSHVVLDLLKNGHQVTVFDDLSTGDEANLFADTRVVIGDILEEKTLERLLQTADFDAAIHLAALKAAGDSMREPQRYAHHNLRGAIALINQLTAHGVRRVLFSSSAAVYGDPRYVPMDEEHPTEPTNFYGFTKLQVEQYLSWLNKLGQADFASLRYFNAAGYDPEGRVKGLEREPKNLIPVTMEVAAGKRQRLEIFGKDYDTRDGTCIRDYVHVSDLAAAHTRAMERLQETGESFILNLGSETGYSVLEVFHAAERILGKSISHAFAARRPGDPAVLTASAAKARDLLGWRPRHSDLRTILETTWRMYRTTAHS